MIGVLRTADDARWYRASIAALVILAWAVLAAWGISPFRGLMTHRTLGEPSVSPLIGFVVFVFGWTLMTIAMMLPSSLPLLNLFRRIVTERPDRARLTARVVLGYLSVWTLFGAVAYRADAFVHAAVGQFPWLAARSAWIAGAILLAAGVYQFTPLKHVCLEKCRSPYSFLVEHWRGARPASDALRLGWRHGLFCLGCCWTLMLLMFAIGGANLGWMLVLGAIMAAERTTRWGRRLTRPLGVALVLLGVLHVSGVVMFPAGS